MHGWLSTALDDLGISTAERRLGNTRISMIPKLLHQTAKTRDIPTKWQGFQRKIQALHPDWTYKLWTDEDNLAFVTAEFPDFLDIYVKLPSNIMRADVIRYLLLYRLGGVYMDLDYEMLKPFDLNEKGVVLPWESEGEFGPGNDKICNAFLASEPGHPFFKLCIDDLKANPPLSTKHIDPEATTGPLFVTRMYHQAVRMNIPVYAPRRELFMPAPFRTGRQQRSIRRKGVSYGIHHCDGSWRQYSWPVEIKRQIGLFVRKFI
jgi:mannosyltransferase OCH1-like enzyme